jgi:hypothetical protein
MANSFGASTYPEVWATSLQERLTGPANWKEICEVHFSDDYTLNLPYMSTEYSLQSGTRGTAYSHSDFTLTNDTLTISSTDIVSVFMDRADAAQNNLVRASEHGARQGEIINERVEDLFLAQHAGWTDFGSDGAGGFNLSSTQITVTVSNVDAIARAVKREIIKAKGMKLANRNGIAIVWRPEDFEKLEESMASQGFTFADMALRDGIMDADGIGKYAFGVYHYVSESHTANHVFAGVRNIQQVGLLKSTYGRIYYNPNAVNGDGPLSGESYEARLDYGFNPKAGLTSILFDVNVA